MSPIILVVMGVLTASVVALAVWAVASFLAPAPKARRAALAALFGGTVGFTTTALVQGPFYMKQMDAVPLTPLVLAVIAAAGMALLAAWMILKAPAPPSAE